jgi:hypothetical protein
MSWKKHFRPVNSVLPAQSRNIDSSYASASKYNSWLPEVYAGPPDRLQRYNIYETMNLDHEIHAALDTIADFSTEEDNETKLPFVFEWGDDPTPNEMQILEKSLRQWCILNEWNKRIWSMFRGVLMYGDQFFIRDPESYKLFWCDPNKVMKVIVNESEGKKIEQYYMKDLDLNLKDLVATSMQGANQDHYGSTSLVFSPPLNGNMNYTSTYYATPGGGTDSFQTADEVAVDANNVVQVTMSDGMNAAWPFGLSILEYVYKVYKQKELLEDSILIYRVHRAPERRVFFIDVGSMPPNKAQQYLERIRYEVQQKRIPSRTGGGQNIVDSAYNPMSMLEDYFFAVTSEGRGSKVETLPGGENLGDIDDLRYFNNKMLRALGVPSSYLPTGPEDGTASYNDGRVGTAFIQEFRFAKVCERYQRHIIKPLDEEFKLFLKKRGVQIDNSLFELKFTPPQSFSEYRQLELDAAQINVFGAMSEVPYISKRFALKRYLGLSNTEVSENEKLWKEEKGDQPADDEPTGNAALGDIGITPSGIDNMAPEGGFEDAEDTESGAEELDVSQDEISNFGEE